MTPLDVARLAFELHANQLQRALGRGGAPVDLEYARVELDATGAALRDLADTVNASPTRRVGEGSRQ